MPASSSKLPEHIGPYVIERRLGAGAMGVVLLARDERLGRRVALKALPDVFADHPEHLARFEREARLLASLQHPNVAALHGVEDVGDRRYLVMEFVDGETLAQRLDRRPPDLAESVDLAMQIARGLSAAHELGIVHRDLKPANVMVTADGRAKVVDFGLAKSVTLEDAGLSLHLPGSATGSAARSASSGSVEIDATLVQTAASDDVEPLAPTVAVGSSASAPLETATGMVLGTAAYMSPEQAKARPVDRRTDVWAFGCLVYECLAGRRAFDGRSLTETLIAVVQNEPDWNALPAATPTGLRRLLERCLRKDPKLRLRDLGDAELELRDLRTPSGSWRSDPAAGPGRVKRLSLLSSWPALGLGLALGLVAGLAPAGLGLWRSGEQTGAMRQIEFEMPLAPAQLDFDVTTAVAFHPAGDSLVWVPATSTENLPLMRRDLDRLESVPIEGTEGGSAPFFSPDGRWLAFVNQGQGELLRVPVEGGRAEHVTDVDPSSRGAVWLPAGSSASDSDLGTIVFNGGFDDGLYRVPAAGGEPQALTRPDRQAMEKSHRFPQLLPGGRVLFTISDATIESFDNADLAVVDVADGHLTKRVLQGASDARWLATGHLAYVRDGRLYTVPFDPETLQATGDATARIEGVAAAPQNGFAQFSVSPRGDLVYAPGGSRAATVRLLRVDRRDGTRSYVDAPIRAYTKVQLDPSGQRAVLEVDSASADLWTLDLERSILERLTQVWDNTQPQWSADGRFVYFSSNQDQSRPRIFRIEPSAGARPEPVGPPQDAALAIVSDVSHDGSRLLLTRQTDSGSSIVALRVDGSEAQDRADTVLVDGPGLHVDGALSPDERWLAFASTSSGGGLEVYLQELRDFRPTGSRLRVSPDGGLAPTWSADGTEILYRHGADIYAVDFDGERRSLGTPRPVFEDLDFFEGGPPIRSFDLFADGDLIVTVVAAEEPVTRLRLVTGWLGKISAAD